ncbi:prefoldin subunit beta [Candidatus Bathyarchaeota archaeon]|jgi:prefoldin beta subunit|nr:prefoldin subunit beta [Candidatus Bathyarchaeota archaeon]MDP6049324.1 prefoldin subunit beta [Candidatus Bathyarchaeota archaeon]MDP7207350.1 prefoldin subunit beta [Candidatus Bathyarchaeota archaeon]|tara:strand:- start:1639 stop:1995 length:357 start_codon:yes stop_codon:yes gene_type:complete
MSSLNQLPPNIQEKLNRLQQLQSTLQQLILQKQRLDLERNESERALKLLDDVPSDKKVYKSSGAILVEKEKGDVETELRERLDFLEMRAKVLTKQEANSRKRLNDLQESLQQDLKLGA